MKKISFITLLLIFSCARKLPPPNPDIFPPEIVDYFVPNNYTLKIKFNENLSPQIDKEKFIIFSSKETLKILSLFVEKEFLTIITNPQKPLTYLIKGEISDLNNNILRFKLRFKGNPLPDTIKPFIQNIIINKEGISISFSEPLVTTDLYFFSSAIIAETIWQEDKKNLLLKFKEEPKEFSSFIILPTLKDLGGNRLTAGEERFQIFDTAIKFINLTGKVFLKESLSDNSILIFKNKNDNSLSFSLAKKGIFKTKVKKGKYQLVALLDTDLDFYPDFYYQEEQEWQTDTTIFINLLPVKEPKKLDEYLH
jgi:hypothetical protein